MLYQCSCLLKYFDKVVITTVWCSIFTAWDHNERKMQGVFYCELAYACICSLLSSPRQVVVQGMHNLILYKLGLLQPYSQTSSKFGMGMKTVFQFIMPTMQDISMMKCAQCQTLQWGGGYIHCPQNIYFRLSEIRGYFGGYSCTEAYQNQAL